MFLRCRDSLHLEWWNCQLVLKHIRQGVNETGDQPVRSKPARDNLRLHQ